MRREKAPFPSGCEPRPATVAPAGSSRSGRWRQRHRLKHSDAKGPPWAVQRPRGLQREVNAAQASKRKRCGSRPARNTGKAASGREASDTSTDRFRRGSGGGTRGRGGWTQHGKPCRWRGTRQPTAREGQAGPVRVAERSVGYRGSRVTPAEGRDLRWKRWRKGAGSREWPMAYHPGNEQECRTSSHAQAKGTTRAVAVARASTGLTTHRPSSARVRAWCHGDDRVQAASGGTGHTRRGTQS